jgi:beta-galactosidase
MVTEWRLSPAFAERPDPAIRPADGDNNLWAFTRSGTAVAADDAPTWRVWRADLPVRKRIAAQGGRLVLDRVAGRAELWIDGRRVATKDDAPGALAGDVPAGARQVAVLVQSVAGQASGILGSVRLTER